eukprot:Hpha_TRINITY_DN15887_c2_g3::TRINITY_DN15887_c2_g3_i1::g.189746::m.189746
MGNCNSNPNVQPPPQTPTVFSKRRVSSSEDTSSECAESFGLVESSLRERSGMVVGSGLIVAAFVEAAAAKSAVSSNSLRVLRRPSLRMAKARSISATCARICEDYSNADPSDPNKNILEDREGYSLGFKMVGRGDIEGVRALIREACWNVDKADTGDPAKGSVELTTPCMRAVQGGNVEMVKVLVYEGLCDIHRSNVSGTTAIHLAAFFNHPDIADLLIGAGCNVDRQDKRGRTPCHEAVIAGSPEVLRLLLGKGKAKGGILDYTGKCPADSAKNMLLKGTQRKGVEECLQVLREHGCLLKKFHAGDNGGFEPGMRVEALRMPVTRDAVRAVAHIQEVRDSPSGQEVRIEFDGELVSYWASAGDSRFVPVGTSEVLGIGLNPPPNDEGFRGWDDYLARHGYRPAPLSCFGNLTSKKRLPYQNERVAGAYIKDREKFQWEPYSGEKLEVNKRGFWAMGQNIMEMAENAGLGRDHSGWYWGELAKYDGLEYELARAHPDGEDFLKAMQRMYNLNMDMIDHTWKSRSLLEPIAELGHCAALKVLLDRHNGRLGLEQPGIFVQALKAGQLEAIKLLVPHGLDPDSVAACSLAADIGQIPILEYLLCNAQCDMNKEGDEGRSPCQLAARGGHLEAVKLLIGVGCNVNAIHKESGENACHVAALRGDVECLRALLDAGGRVDVRDKQGRTPADVAAAAAFWSEGARLDGCRCCVELLKERGFGPSV